MGKKLFLVKLKTLLNNSSKNIYEVLIDKLDQNNLEYLKKYKIIT